MLRRPYEDDPVILVLFVELQVDEGLLDGKVGRIMEAIDRYPPFVLLPFLYSRSRFLLGSANSEMLEMYSRIPPGPSGSHLRTYLNLP